MKSLPSAVFFDWDGTLADSLAFLEAAHGHARKNLGLPPFEPDEFGNRHFGQPRDKLYKELYGPHEARARVLFETYVRENHLDLTPLDGAEDVLKFFADRDIPMGVVSNKRPEFIVEEIKNFGWADYFVATVGANEAAKDKPAPEPLLLAIKRARVEASLDQIWYIGDTEVDLGCAKGAGCPAVFISDRRR